MEKNKEECSVSQNEYFNGKYQDNLMKMED